MVLMSSQYKVLTHLNDRLFRLLLTLPVSLSVCFFYLEDHQNRAAQYDGRRISLQHLASIYVYKLCKMTPPTAHF